MASRKEDKTMKKLRKVRTCEWTMFFTVFFVCCLLIIVDYQKAPMKFSLKEDLIISCIASFFFGYIPGKLTEAAPLPPTKSNKEKNRK